MQLGTDGALPVQLEDEITRAMVIVHNGGKP